MTSSRSAANARLLSKHQQKQRRESTKSSSSQFTKRQSHFERREAERAVAAMRQHTADPIAVSGGIHSGRGEGFQLSRQQRAAVTAGEADGAGDLRSAPPPRSSLSQRGSSGGFLAPSLVSGGVRPLHQHQHHVPSGRATRRAERFQLAEEKPSDEPSQRRWGGEDQESDNESDPYVNEKRSDPLLPHRTAKEQRFQAIIDHSRRERAEKQRERAERDAAATALDAEFDALVHLLPKRDKREEERRAFQQSGTPEVRALLRAYKQKRGKHARQLVVRSVAKERQEGEDQHRDASNTNTTSTNETTPTKMLVDVSYVVPLSEAIQTTTRGAEAGVHTPGGTRHHHSSTGSSGITLDSADLQRLEQIRWFAEEKERQQKENQKEQGEEEDDEEAEKAEDEVDDVDGIASMEAAVASRANRSGGGGGGFDDFDRLLHAFTLDPQRAHATQRLLTEEEEAEKAEARRRLEQDRAAIPSLGALEAEDQIQRTRREWLERGGDRAFQMNTTGAGEGVGGDGEDDGISLSSLDDEGDEDEDEVEEDETVKDSGATITSGRSPSLSGSPTLDRLLQELETLACESDNEIEEENENENERGTKKRETQSRRRDAFHRLVLQLYRLGQQHPVLLTNTFRTILLEAERVSLRGRVPRRALTLTLLAAIQIFPLTDYRHPVSTPLLLYLSSAVFQLHLRSRAAVRGLLLLSGLLTSCVIRSEGRKFIPEAITAVFNVLALQAPLSLLSRGGLRFQGLRVLFPLIERHEYEASEEEREEGRWGHVDSDARPLVSATGCTKCNDDVVEDKNDNEDSEEEEKKQKEEERERRMDEKIAERSVLHLLTLAADANPQRRRSFSHEKQSQKHQHHTLAEEDEHWLCAGYAMLLQIAEAYHSIPAFPVLFLEPMESLHALLVSTTSSSSAPAGEAPLPSSTSSSSFRWSPSPVLHCLHHRVLERLRHLAATQVARRTPLAMRTFRPRPLRQFDPLLEEREEVAVKSEIRELKKVVREDKKRVLRHVQAEASVTRRRREAENAVVEAQREKAYHRVLGQLQAQQHVMNTVDAAMERARKKVKKGISGAPKESSGEGLSDIPSY